MDAAPMDRFAPLIEPGPELSAQQRNRYARHLGLAEIGEIGQRRLLAARVLVIGAGGLGSPVLQYLAAAGIGTLGIVDDDRVEESNLQRQLLHRSEDIGELKVVSAAATVMSLTPDSRVRVHPLRLTADTAERLFAEYDVIVDGSDNFPTRYVVADAAAAAGLPVVWGSVLGLGGQVSLFWSKAGLGYRDVFPEPEHPEQVPDCVSGGVLGAVCGVIGSVMAAETVKVVCGSGRSLLGRIQIHDVAAGTMRTVSVRPGPSGVAERVVADTNGAPRADGTTAGREVTAAELLAALAADTDLPWLLVDVRTDEEFRAGSLPGARNVPLALIRAGAGRDSWEPHTPDTPTELTIVFCHSGVRSAEAAAILSERGVEVLTLAGGVVAWSALGAELTVGS